MMRFQKTIIVLSLIGMAITIYLINQHYKPDDTSFCNFNSYVNCDIVNKSEYSEILGIPVSVFGFLAYVFFFAFSAAAFKNKAWTKKALLPTTLFSLASLGFSLYLTYLEFYVIYAVCIFCLAQQLLILLITLLLFVNLWSRRKKLLPA